MRSISGHAGINRKIPPLLAAIIVVASVGLAGCATANVEGQKIALSKADPYERVNRKIFYFNDQVDNYIAEPVSDVYRAITPQFVQTGIFNFYNNLKNINVVVNDVLQAKFQQGARDTGRFVVNSTLGLLGVVDAAKSLDLEQNEEDFEQTLAVWCVPRGPYLVLPLLGPTTARGIPGSIFDAAADPSNYVGAPVQLLSLLNTRANAEGALKFIDEAALDPYVFTRESFLQWRQSLASDGKFQSLDNFDEEFEDDIEASSGYNRFVSDAKKFAEVSSSFEKVAESFESTAKIFQNASQKLDEPRNKLD